MREILFRGKRVDNGEWVYGSYGLKLNVATGEHDEYIMESVYSGTTNSSYFIDYKIIPGTAGQYTGMTDRNGNKIFEGDILEFDEYPGENYLLEIAKDEEPPHNFIVGYRKKPNANVQGISHGIFTILEDLPRGCKIISNTSDMED